jgi:hypothetical protein
MKTIFFRLFITSFICGSCHHDSVAPIPSAIGEDYQGGIVFYIDGSGKHGLIAAKADQNNSVTWWNGTFVATGAASLTDGKVNTNKIISVQGQSGEYAALACQKYSGGSYHDWYLPSKDELNALYLQSTIVKGFTLQIYWSSSEYETGSIWVQDFQTGEQHLDNSSDGANVAVRAIRKY